MECDEIIEFIHGAEFALETMARIKPRNPKAPSALSVAACAYAEMASDRDDATFADECRQLFQLTYWVEELRKGNDPRCSLCKQNGQMKWFVPVHKIHEVLQ